MQYMELIRAGDQNAINEFLANHNNGGPVPDDNSPALSLPPKTMMVDADDTIAGLAKQLEAQENQLISIQDGIGALDEKLWELRELAAKFPTPSMLESLSEKLDEILEKINEGGDYGTHVEWPNA
jgi:hypothetical protein